MYGNFSCFLVIAGCNDTNLFTTQIESFRDNAISCLAGIARLTVLTEARQNLKNTC